MLSLMTTLPREDIGRISDRSIPISNDEKHSARFVDQSGAQGIQGRLSRMGRGSTCLTALTIAAEGGKADIAKPMRGLGSGVFEIALPFRGDAFRVVYAVQFGEDI